MEISIAVDQDKQNLKKIAEETLSGLDSLSSDQVELFVVHTANNIDSYIGKDNCVFLKCLFNGDIIGYVLVKEFWNLSDLFVLPRYQKNGAGKLLLMSAIKQCEVHGLGYVRLNSSLRAEPFYKKFGFQYSLSHKSKQANTVPLELHF